MMKKLLSRGLIAVLVATMLQVTGSTYAMALPAITDQPVFTDSSICAHQKDGEKTCLGVDPVAGKNEHITYESVRGVTCQGNNLHLMACWNSLSKEDILVPILRFRVFHLWAREFSQTSNSWQMTLCGLPNPSGGTITCVDLWNQHTYSYWFSQPNGQTLTLSDFRVTSNGLICGRATSTVPTVAGIYCNPSQSVRWKTGSSWVLSGNENSICASVGSGKATCYDHLEDGELLQPYFFGRSFSCVSQVQLSKITFCKGVNQKGQLGAGDSQSSTSQLPGYSKLFGSNDYTCGSDSSGFYCWGDVPGLGVTRTPTKIFTRANILSFPTPTVASRKITINWDLNNFEEKTVTGFRLEQRLASEESWTLISNVAASTSSFSFNARQTGSVNRFRVTAIYSDMGTDESESAEVIVPGYADIKLHIKGDNQKPVVGGKYTWSSADGRSRSAKSYLATALGEVILRNVIAGTGEICVSNAQFKNKRIDGCWSDLGLYFGELNLQIASVPDETTRTVTVKLPSGAAVPGASVSFDSWQDGWYSTPIGVSNQPSAFHGRVTLVGVKAAGLDNVGEESPVPVVTNHFGQAFFTGFWSGTNTVSAHFADAFTEQSTQSMQLVENTELQFDYMPEITLETSQIEGAANQIVSVSVALGGQSSQSFSIAGTRIGVASLISVAAVKKRNVKITPPSGSNQNACGRGKTKLSSNFSSDRAATLKICTDVSGLYQISGYGAVASSDLIVHVRGSKPTEPTNLGIVDLGQGSVQVAWSEPDYAGGLEITGYQITFQSKTKASVKRTINLQSADLTQGLTKIIEGLPINNAWEVSVSARNSKGLGTAAKRTCFTF